MPHLRTLAGGGLAPSTGTMLTDAAAIENSTHGTVMLATALRTLCHFLSLIRTETVGAESAWFDSLVSGGRGTRVSSCVWHRQDFLTSSAERQRCMPITVHVVDYPSCTAVFTHDLGRGQIPWNVDRNPALSTNGRDVAGSRVISSTFHRVPHFRQRILFDSGIAVCS